MNSTSPRPLPRSLAHHGAIALLCAVVSYVPIYFLRTTNLVGGASDAAVDFVMRQQADRTTAKPGPPTTLLDFDDAAYAKADRPLVFPRSKLAELLDHIAAAGPKLIVVDVDIGWRDTDTEEKALEASLARLKAKASPPMLLVREGIPRWTEDQTPYLRPTRYDRLVGPGSNLRWVSATLNAASDGIVRRAKPWTSVCANNRVAVLPGVQVAAWAALHAPGAIAGFDKLQSQFHAQGGACDGGPGPIRPADTQISLTLGEQTRSWSDDIFANRVMLRYSWNSGRLIVPSAKSPGEIAFAVSPVAPLLKHSEAATDLLHDRIVIIGVSAAAARDIHHTPLGDMPGAMFIANLLFTQLGEGLPSESGFLTGLFFSLLMSAITFGIWVLSRRVLNFNIVLVREVIRLVLTVFWGLIAWLFLSHSAVLDYAFPQYVVITYLAYAEGFDMLF